eukprot:TRINITY_DN2693_c0_g1_i2.p1 TRINITY_DN2693_c0_g1~~TRINITY_DN2693_c0_g1_i2.p1  ORF type:complete len:1252 (+),score=315.24 TRINITY_DN2693_c0_g1_i2:1186-4941(+)
MERGWLLACFFGLTCFLLSISLQQMTSYASRVGIRVRAAVMTAVYRKALVTEAVASKAGDVLTLVANDCSRLHEGCTNIHYLWSGPLECATIIGLVFGEVGVAAVVGVVVIVLVIPLQYGLGILIARIRRTNGLTTDSRVQIMHEIVSAIKLVKFYAWEASFAETVTKLRAQETKLLRRSSILKSIHLMVVFLIPPLLVLGIFAVYLNWQDKKLESPSAFTILSMFNTLRFPLVVLPVALKNFSDTLNALKRIQGFLNSPEIQPVPKSSNVGITYNNATLSYKLGGTEEDVAGQSLGVIDPRQGTVSALTHEQFTKNASAHSAGSVADSQSDSRVVSRLNSFEKTEFQLKGLNFDVRPGQIIAVVGPVGGGKSTIINGILGEAKIVSGSMTVGGTLAYVPQTAWIQQATVRDNILFGRPFDEERYRKTIFACALERDCEILPDGDLTEIGESGINLSGGQKQRIALARAVYSDADIMLFDSPLSAVDQHTCNHIFRHCIKGELLRGKITVLLTHQLHLLQSCDLVCIIADGQMRYCGPHSRAALAEHFSENAAEIAEKSLQGVYSDDLPQKPEEVPAEKRSPHMVRRGSKLIHPLENPTGTPKFDAKSDDKAEGLKLKRKPSMSGRDPELEAAEPPVSKESRKDRFKSKERSVTWDTYYQWFYRMTIAAALISLVMYAGTQVVRILSDLFVRRWTRRKAAMLDTKYTIIYMIYVIVFMVALLFRGLIWFFTAIRAATILHDDLFRNVLRAPLSFFTVTPMGPLLNCFSKQQDQVDETLPDAFHMGTIYFMILGTTVGVIISVIPYFAIILGILVIVFFLLQKFQGPLANFLKMRTAASNTPIFAHVAESLRGILVLRAFEAEPRFRRDSLAHINKSNTFLFNLEHLQCAGAFLLDTYASLMVLATALFVVGFHDKSYMDGANAGLVISNCLQMLVFLTLMVRAFTEARAQMSAVESILHYTNQTKLLKEGSQLDDKPATPMSSVHGPGDQKAIIPIGSSATGGMAARPKWPSAGLIEFDGVTMSYFKDSPPVLRQVTFTIHPREKIGIVGRTGSGKSSLLIAMFRLVEPSGGTIIIDGRDVSKMPLDELRGSLSIIPQEPVLFKGTIRSNMDPFNLYSDDQLWTAIRTAHLEATVSALPLKLDAPVLEHGRNFSLGQKQLFCLARVILKDSKILVLDEATAALDLDTDALIQATIREFCRDRVVMTIAHRLETVMDYDKILFMDHGRVIEFGKREDLLADPKSAFYSLVNG